MKPDTEEGKNAKALRRKGAKGAFSFVSGWQGLY